MIVGVVGAGIMGSGIAQLAAMSGCEVRLFDIYTENLSKALMDITISLGKLALKGVIKDAEISGITGRLYLCDSLEMLSDSHLVIEAVAEVLDIKKELFKKLEPLVSDDCILASNTSSLSIASIASVLDKPQRFLGIHFFNPAVMMNLTEIIPGIHTQNQYISTATKIIESWGKTTVRAKDTPGFIVNKVARPFYSEALRIFEEGIADIITIDAVMKFSGFRMGPFELMDFIGHDVNYRVTESVWKSYYFENRFKPSITQLRLLEAGLLGKKVGQGFYKYPKEDNSPLEMDNITKEKVFLRIISMLVNEAADTVYFGICNKKDLENAVKLGLNYPYGLFEWAEMIGYQKIVNQLDDLYAFYHEERYRACPFLRKEIL